MSIPAASRPILQKYLSLGLGALVIAVGCLVIAGWLLGNATLKSVLPGLATMKANTALSFILAGISLSLLVAGDARKRARRIAQVCALAVALVSLLTLWEYASGRDLGIDQMLFLDTETVFPNPPGRPSPATAYSFLFLGSALFSMSLGTARGYLAAQLLAIPMGLISLVALLGYAHGVESLYKLSPYSSLALHTAFMFFALSTGILLARPDRGLMALRIRLTLHTKLAVGSLLILMPVLILLMLNFVATYELQRNEVLVDQTHVAQVISVMVDDAFDEGVAIAQSYATDPVILSFDRERIDSHLARLVPIYPNYDGIGVFDARGDLVGSAIPRGAVNVADREWFQEVMRTGKPTVSDVVISRGSGRPVVSVSAPIVDRDGRRVGAVVPALSLDRFPQSLEPVRRAQGQQIFLVDRTGRVAFHTQLTELTWEERDASTYLPVRTALEGNPFVSEQMVGLFGDQRVIAVVPTPKHGWVLGVSIPVDMALAPVDRSLRRTLAILVAVVALTTGLSLWLADFLSRPVKQLTENAVALGRGDLRRRVKIATRDEVEDLANAFNWMAGALADKEAQLRDHAARLEQINRELEGFSYSVSHDLRAPLRAIDGFSHALLEDYADKLDEQGKGYLDRVRAASQRMAQLIDDLLSLSRLTRSEVRREQVDLSALVGTIAAELRQTEPERQVEFVIAEGLVAMGDTRLLRVALENLLGNAWKFTGKHPSARIEFGVVEQDGKPAYFVRDDGAGFDMAYADRLFGAFQRLHTPMEFPGSGIGLATVQRIIHRHGGDVWAEGAVEQGATFYFTL